MSYQKPKGTQDILPQEVEKWQYFEQTAREWCRRFNYKEIRVPIFENTDLFIRGVGETTDVVSKEMYTFEDKGKRSMTLRPEGTAGVVRSFVENKLYAEPDVTKLYYTGPMFRYEQPQAGRYRQFHQFGIEAFGSVDPTIDAEAIALGYYIITDLGIRDVTIELNSVGNAESRAAYKEKLKTYLQPMKEGLCKDCQSRFEKNPMRILDCKIDGDKFHDAPSILDSLDEACLSHFTAVQDALMAMDIPFKVNPNMVRGLDYYTLTAFEYTCEGIGAIHTIGGGGRYNGLVGDIGGPDKPGIGFGLGMERIMLMMDIQEVALPNKNPLDIYFIGLGEQADKEVTRLLYKARNAGLRVDKDYMQRKMKAQMKAADRNQARYAAILGEDELLQGNIMLKNLSTGEQEIVPIASLIEHVKRT
ncbi:histidine--tRNA ligase [Longirhabdus pacifica]|uniref:histidine--tRNA ligase n=1 Tax=Longirhabdus pacifica TaxID=2305227 RepID=UPI0010092EFE|nr:histidine--tRNA ligase [Longirhabdus pacifica]